MLTEETIKSKPHCENLLEKIKRIKPNEEIVYFSGRTGHVNCGASLSNSPDAVWDLFRYISELRELNAAYFLQRKTTSSKVVNEYDYIVVGK